MHSLPRVIKQNCHRMKLLPYQYPMFGIRPWQNIYWQLCYLVYSDSYHHTWSELRARQWPAVSLLPLAQSRLQSLWHFSAPTPGGATLKWSVTSWVPMIGSLISPLPYVYLHYLYNLYIRMQSLCIYSWYHQAYWDAYWMAHSGWSWWLGLDIPHAGAGWMAAHRKQLEALGVGVPQVATRLWNS